LDNFVLKNKVCTEQEIIQLKFCVDIENYNQNSKDKFIPYRNLILLTINSDILVYNIDVKYEGLLTLTLGGLFGKYAITSIEISDDWNHF